MYAIRSYYAEYLRAYEAMANLATKSAIEGQAIAVRAPLIDMPKAGIVALALRLGVDNFV